MGLGFGFGFAFGFGFGWGLGLGLGLRARARPARVRVRVRVRIRDRVSSLPSASEDELRLAAHLRDHPGPAELGTALVPPYPPPAGAHIGTPAEAKSSLG